MTNFQYTETKYMLTVQETARVLGVSIHTVYKIISSGKLTALKVSQERQLSKQKNLKDILTKNKNGGLYL